MLLPIVSFEGQIVGNDLDTVCRVEGRCTNNLLNVLDAGLKSIGERLNILPRGIFRIVGSIRNQKVAVKKINTEGLFDFNDLNPGDVAVVVKKILATTYKPLLLEDQYDRIVNFASVDEKLKHKEMRDILDKVERVSKVYHKTLTTLFGFLNELENYYEVTEMTPHNYALIFAPGLARNCDGYCGTPSKTELDNQRIHLAPFIEYCINHTRTYVPKHGYVAV